MSTLRNRIEICSIIIHLACILKEMNNFLNKWYVFSVLNAGLPTSPIRSRDYITSLAGCEARRSGSFESYDHSKTFQKTIIYLLHYHHDPDIPDMGTRDISLEKKCPTSQFNHLNFPFTFFIKTINLCIGNIKLIIRISSISA